MLRDYKEAHKALGFCEGTRPQGDFYATPPQAVHKLLAQEHFGNLVLEPCCGNGAISKALQEHNFTVVSRDLFDWGYGETGKDFLTEPITPVDAVITNPPFKYSLQFTQKALECTQSRGGKVAMLNRIQWLESEKRRKLFQGSPLSRVWVFAKRLPRFHRYDFTGKASTSVLCFAWFVFDWTHKGEPVLGWL